MRYVFLLAFSLLLLGCLSEEEAYNKTVSKLKSLGGCEGKQIIVHDNHKEEADTRRVTASCGRYFFILECKDGNGCNKPNVCTIIKQFKYKEDPI